MKKVTKFFMAALLAGMCSFGYGQDVKVNINNQDYTTTQDCDFTINGICSSEDIGGVDVEFNTNEVVFTNYNSFTVTTLCQIEYKAYKNNYEGWVPKEKTLNIVLTANGSKTIDLHNATDGSVLGMIVRKLKEE